MSKDSQPQMPAQMVIANRLRDGLTVFLSEDHGWVEAIGGGAIARTTGEAEALLDVAHKAAASHIVVGPYLIAISETALGRRPRDWREAIRAYGPTVETAGG